MVNTLLNQNDQITNADSNGIPDMAPSIAEADAILASFGYVDAEVAELVA